MADNCFSYIPSVEEYFAAYSTVLIVLLVVIAVVLLVVIAFFAQVVQIILQRYDKQCQLPLIVSNGIYAVIVALCIVSLSVPLVSDKLDLVSIILFSWCVFAFYRYIIVIGGGHSSLQSTYESSSFRLAEGRCFRRIIYRILGKYSAVRISIIQFPFVTTVLLAIQFVLYFIDIDRYYNSVFIFLPFLLVSIILYLLSFSLLVRYIAPSFPDSQIARKFQFLRLVVIVIKFQTIILDIIFRQLHFECDWFAGEAWSLHNLIKQPLIVLQITLLAFATWTLYRKEAKKELRTSVS